MIHGGGRRATGVAVKEGRLSLDKGDVRATFPHVKVDDPDDITIDKVRQRGRNLNFKRGWFEFDGA